MNIVYQGKTKTGKDILIRYPEIGDLEKLLEYINTLSDERTFIRVQGEHKTLEDEEKWLKERLKEIEEKKTVHLLVFSGEILIGAGEIRMMDRTEKHVGILGVTVAKSYRRDGIGKMLMELIINEAKKELLGLEIITLEVFSTNEVARNLYKKMGFIEYGLLPNGIARDEKYEDAVLMYRNV